MRRFSVKDVVKKTGLTRETLRYYEKTGLLSPPQRGGNGYRQFTEQDLERLQFILMTKQAGFKIREIRELIGLKNSGEASCRVGRDIALERIRRVDQQIASLRDIRAILGDFVKCCEAEGLDQPCSLSFNLKPESILLDQSNSEA